MSVTRPETIHVFLDANSVLHYQRPDQIDWLTLTGAELVTLIAAPVLIRELEKHKYGHARPHIKRRAAERVKWLAEVADGADGIEIRPGVSLSFLIKEPTLDYDAHHLDRANPDDVLIANMLEYDAVERSHIRVATADLGLRLKARHRALKPIVLPDETRLPDERDPAQQELEQLRREVTKYQARLPKLTLSFGEATPDQPLRISLPRRSDYSTHPTVQAMRGRYPPLPGNWSGNEDVRQFNAVGFDLDGQLAGKISDHYNQQLERYFEAYGAFLAEHAEWVDCEALTFEIALTLRNIGNAVASDVGLTLRLPSDVRIMAVEDRTLSPKPPMPPRDPLVDGVARSYHPHPSARPSAWSLEFDYPGPTFVSDGEPEVDGHGNSVTFTLDSLKHHCAESLNPFLARFVATGAMRSFNAEYRITAVEMPEPAEGTLHFVMN